MSASLFFNVDRRLQLGDVSGVLLLQVFDLDLQFAGFTSVVRNQATEFIKLAGVLVEGIARACIHVLQGFEVLLAKLQTTVAGVYRRAVVFAHRTGASVVGRLTLALVIVVLAVCPSASSPLRQGKLLLT